jgi:hypothetical protein
MAGWVADELARRLTIQGNDSYNPVGSLPGEKIIIRFQSG